MRLGSSGKHTPPGVRTGLRAMARLHAGLRMDRRAEVLSEHIAGFLPASVSVLDVGAGNGRLARAIMIRRPDVTIRAIDTKLWPDAVIDVKAFDGRRIPFPDRSYDVCLVSDVVHHCLNPMDLMREMTRVAGRYVVIKDHVAESVFDHKLLRMMDWFGNRGHDVQLTYDYWPWRRWEDTFECLGLEVRARRMRLGLYPMPLSRLLDRNLHFIALLEVSCRRP